jgi:hypothetical protein
LLTALRQPAAMPAPRPSLLRAAPILALALAACDTGTPPYFGIAPERVSAGGMVFDVRVRGLMAEALRQEVMWPPSHEAVAIRAAAAMRQVTGCEVVAVRGDPSVVEGRLECGDETAPAFGRTRNTKLVLCTFERRTIAEPAQIEDYEARCS